MATITKYVATCDGPLRRHDDKIETTMFLVNGVKMEIELCGLCSTKFAKVTEPFTSAARRVRKYPGVTRGKSNRPAAQKARQWARDHGYEVGTRGRIPQYIFEEMRAA